MPEQHRARFILRNTMNKRRTAMTNYRWLLPELVSQFLMVISGRAKGLRPVV